MAKSAAETSVTTVPVGILVPTQDGKVPSQ